MAKLVLDTSFVEEDFFSDSRLMAIGSSLQGYSLCWWLNQLFDLNFQREPEMDICIQEGKVLAPSSGTLFDLVQPEIIKKQYHFPVYRHELSYFDSSVFLYTNRCSVKKLIPEVKHADYLLLVQYASYMEPENDFYHHLNQVSGISWVSEIEVEGLKSKRNLIL